MSRGAESPLQVRMQGCLDGCAGQMPFMEGYLLAQFTPNKDWGSD